MALSAAVTPAEACTTAARSAALPPPSGLSHLLGGLSVRLLLHQTSNWVLSVARAVRLGLVLLVGGRTKTVLQADSLLPLHRVLRPCPNALQAVGVPRTVDPLRLQVVQPLPRLLGVVRGGAVHSPLRHATRSLRAVVAGRGGVLGVRALHRLAAVTKEGLLSSTTLVGVGLLCEALLITGVLLHVRVAVRLLPHVLLLLLPTVVVVRGGRGRGVWLLH